MLSRPLIILLVFTAAVGSGRRFRGGRQRRRDRWYGLDHAEGFNHFIRWWHRIGKDEAGGADLQSAEE